MQQEQEDVCSLDRIKERNAAAFHRVRGLISDLRAVEEYEAAVEDTLMLEFAGKKSDQYNRAFKRVPAAAYAVIRKQLA